MLHFYYLRQLYLPSCKSFLFIYFQLSGPVFYIMVCLDIKIPEYFNLFIFMDKLKLFALFSVYHHSYSVMFCHQGVLRAQISLTLFYYQSPLPSSLVSALDGIQCLHTILWREILPLLQGYNKHILSPPTNSMSDNLINYVSVKCFQYWAVVHFILMEIIKMLVQSPGLA